jgi:YgiT-type zinc finger domain-containing protein
MKCVICKMGEVQASAEHRAEVKVGTDRLLVLIEAEVCGECGEAYYSEDAMRQLEKVREDFSRRTITPPSIGRVYQVS